MTNSNNLTDKDRLFRRLALLTVLIIYLLVLAGGIVRSTGSGMGCPDWPKCFGQWIPPTNVSELPVNYQEIYGHRGYANTTFNPAKTWIEYVNRLLGVLTGFFIFFTLIASLRYRKRDGKITLLSFFAFVSVGIQGWLGSVVVKTVLTPWVVTLHMVLAMIIVGLLLYVVVRTYSKVLPKIELNNKGQINKLLIISTGLLLLQIVLGTQVRQMIDLIAKQSTESLRGTWLTTIGITFYIHRSFSLVVLGSQILWFVQLRKFGNLKPIGNLARGVLVTILANILTGVIMAYFDIPSFAQPIHLTLAVIALGIQFVILLLLNREQLLAKEVNRVTESSIQV